MDIIFEKDKLKEEYNNFKVLVKKYGDKRAKIIRQRLDDLSAAANLEVMRNLPGRCHELRGDRKWQLSMDAGHPYRLIFMPANEPVPVKSDGGLDWKQVTVIKILGVVDTHA
ncbi:MAG: killer suppression protein [Candidatus Eremiobacterota bacterium]